MTGRTFRAEVLTPTRIRLYRGSAVAGHIYTHDVTFGWWASDTEKGAPLGKKAPTPIVAAFRRWGQSASDAVADAIAERPVAQ